MFQEPNSSSKISVCSISLLLADRMSLIGVPEGLIDGFREAITKGWKKGIKQEIVYHGAFEFKFHGFPWSGPGEESVGSRHLIVAVLTYMAQNGWNLLQSADLTKKTIDKDTMFFELREPDPEAHLFSMTFNLNDRIRLAGGPDDVISSVKESIQNHWELGIKEESDFHGALELKLGGKPWNSCGPDAIYAKILMNNILADLRTYGYKLYASIDMSYSREDKGLESWFFRKVGKVWS